MPDWLNIRVDGLSFFLGVAAGTLFWVVFSQFKGWFPRLLAIGKQILHNFRERNLSGVEAAVRLDTLRRAQKSHLAAQLFSLDEVLIPPKLIAPPPLLDPTQAHFPDSLISTLFPALPDWPEQASQYPLEFLTLAEAIQLNANLVVVGQPGSGKTTALAHLATQLARKDPSLNAAQSLVPIFLHIHDLLPQVAPGSITPLAIITRVITSRVPIFAQNQVPAFLKITLADNRVLLLLDGLDELPTPSLKEAVVVLDLLLKENPKLRVVTTGSPLFLDGLIELGFHPVTLAAWNRDERVQFIQKWGRNWKDKIQPEIKRKLNTDPLDPTFVNNWIQPNQLHLTPLDWTLSLWSIYAGQAGSASAIGAAADWLTRLLPDSNLLAPLYSLALDVVKNQKSCFSHQDLENLSTREALNQTQVFDPAANPTEALPSTKGKAAKEKPSINASPWISALVQSGVLTEHPGRVYRFCHPVLTAYLAASVDEEVDIFEWMVDVEAWDVRQLTLAFYCGIFAERLILPSEWMQSGPPLFRKALNLGRWLKFIPANHPARSRALKRLADGLLDERGLLSVSFRFSTALTCANDSLITSLFRQLLTSPKASARSMACLALGAMGDEKSLNPIANLLSDPVNEVRRDACFAIGNLRNTGAYEIMNECLSAEDEILRQAAAESLAGHAPEGHAILNQAVQSENLLVRRSAVSGLVLVKQTWSKELLEKIAIQDGQWVVRNAAIQALDVLQKPQSRTPYPLTPPSETPWLLGFANKQGVGIPPGDPAQGILLDALQAGNEEEQIAALNYLRGYSDEKVITAITNAAMHGEPILSESAQLALWYIACRLPESIKVTRTGR